MSASIILGIFGILQITWVYKRRFSTEFSLSFCRPPCVKPNHCYKVSAQNQNGVQTEWLQLVHVDTHVYATRGCAA